MSLLVIHIVYTCARTQYTYSHAMSHKRSTRPTSDLLFISKRHEFGQDIDEGFWHPGLPTLENQPTVNRVQREHKGVVLGEINKKGVVRRSLDSCLLLSSLSGQISPFKLPSLNTDLYRLPNQDRWPQEEERGELRRDRHDRPPHQGAPRRVVLIDITVWYGIAWYILSYCYSVVSL